MPKVSPTDGYSLPQKRRRGPDTKQRLIMRLLFWRFLELFIEELKKKKHVFSEVKIRKYILIEENVKEEENVLSF